jgi:hypothetical protein
MDDPERRAAFEAALNNQYFVLQSSAGNTLSESGTRASLFMLFLSSTLVSIGFVAQTRSLLGPFLAVVLPSLFLLGVFTVVRLVDTGVQNVTYLREMARIRHYYAGLTPDAPRFFGTTGDDLADALDFMAVGSNRFGALFTIASMIAIVDSIVGGAGVTLFVAWLLGGLDHYPFVSVGLGVLAGIALVAGFLLYQDRHFEALRPEAPGKNDV